MRGSSTVRINLRALLYRAFLPSNLFLGVFVIDVDGVLTDGTFLYDASGKQFKNFGPDDSDALKILRRHLRVVVVSADERGFEITRRRVADMGLELCLVPSAERLNWIQSQFPLNTVAYMGDSFLDAQLLRSVAFGICPRNGHSRAKAAASFVTRSVGGNRAVAEACAVIAKIMRLPEADLL